MLVILCKNDEIQKIISRAWKSKTEWSRFDENDAIYIVVYITESDLSEYTRNNGVNAESLIIRSLEEFKEQGTDTSI